MYSDYDDQLPLAGFPHSEILGSMLVCQLPQAYRRLLRRSSPLTAKASVVCAYSLDHITQSSLQWLLHPNSFTRFRKFFLAPDYTIRPKRLDIARVKTVINRCVSFLFYLSI